MTDSNIFIQSLGIRYPLICGAMYPCSNPELVAAVSEAGGIGIIQPLTLSYVCGYDFREGIKYIRSLTSKPIGLNVLIEGSSKIYMDRMKKYVDIALEENIKFFVTALGNPKWVVEKAHAVGALVYHDVTERRWALKAIDAGVDGLICVNNLAGGHAGVLSPEELYQELKDLNKPLICAGGVGDKSQYQKMLSYGYQAVQMGTRFVAAQECHASAEYKKAIVAAKAKDIVLTERLTGVPVSVINTSHVQKLGLQAGPLARQMLKHPRLKHWMRLYYSIKSFRDLKRSIRKPNIYDEYWQAGKSAEGIHSIETASDIVAGFNSAP